MVSKSEIDSKMSEATARERRGRLHGEAWCWAARFVSLVPGVAATVYASLDVIRRWATYGFGHDLLGFYPFFCFAALVVPGIVAWRWHGLGGFLLVGQSVLHILWIAASMAGHTSYGYFELAPSYVLRSILPIWTGMFIGGCLHFIAWSCESGEEEPGK
jgi:hypothetical protein